MTPEQKLELDNIVKQTIKIEDIAASLSNIEKSIFSSEEIIRKSLTDIVPVPTYELTSSSSQVIEGDIITFILKVTGLPEGTLVPYHITGVSPTDINDKFSGNFILNKNGLSTLIVLTNEDLLTEGTENITLTLDNGLASVSVVILDTSIDPLPQN